MLTRNDVETALDYMNSHNLIRLARPTGQWHMMHCPFHNSGQERRPSCGCSLEGSYANGVEHFPGTFHCFSCGVSYPFGKGILEILASKGTSLQAHPDLKKYVDETAGRIETNSLIPEGLMASIQSKYAAESLRMRVRSMSSTSYISEEELAKYRFTVPYMYQRKLTDAVIEKYDVGFDGNYLPPGRKKPVPCVTFPVRDIQGHTLFIVRRSIEGKFFFMPTEIEKSLYGIYELPPNTKEVIVCESIFNALTCVVYGHPAVALLGTGSTHTLDQLKKLGASSYVLCLDNDEAGRKGTQRVKKALSNFAMVWTMTIPWEGKDVNDLIKEEFEYCYSTRE